MRDRLPWSRVIAGGAGLLALLVAGAEVGNWGIFLQFLYQVPYGADDPLYNKDIGFYLFSLPAYIVIKNWMLLTLVLSALFAGAIYWVHGDIEYDVHHRSMSPTVIAHGSALLGLLLRGEGLVLWSRPLSAALRRQRRRRRRKLHRYTCGATRPVAIDRAFDHRGVRRVGKPPGAHLPASCRRVRTRRPRLFRAVRRSPCVVPALLRQTNRVAAGEALHRTQHRAHPGRHTISIRSQPSRLPPNRSLPSRR